MRNVGRFRRLSFVLGTVVVLVAALVGTQLATRPVKACPSTALMGATPVADRGARLATWAVLWAAVVLPPASLIWTVMGKVPSTS